MKRISIIIFLLIFVPSEAQTSIFDSLLIKNVDSTGKVDYQSFKKDELLLDEYLSYLKNNTPSKNWSANNADD